jgi:hypothetical protein
MRLAVPVDIIAITARIAIILASADDRSKGSSENRASDRSSPGSEARENRARDGSDTRADRGSGGRAGNDMVLCRGCRTATERKAARGGNGNYETIHGHALQGYPNPSTRKSARHGQFRSGRRCKASANRVENGMKWS